MVAHRLSYRLSAVFVLALLVALSGASRSLAYHPLTNREFGPGPCSLASWNIFTTAGGTVTVNTEAAYGLSGSPNCVAELESHSAGPVERAVMKQEFHPPLVGPAWINADLWLRTAGGPVGAPAQIIQVYDLTAGVPVCTNQINDTSAGIVGYSCDIGGSVGNHLELRFIARADAAAGFPDVWLYTDHLQIFNAPRCPVAAPPGSAQICP